MTAPLRLVLFDVDGTLVDSQAHIFGSMQAAFQDEGLPVPSRASVLGGVGLSLPMLMLHLVPDESAETHARLVAHYKAAYVNLRSTLGEMSASPLYPGIRALIDGLHEVPENLLGVATGKSRRGLDHVMEAHSLEHRFITRQVADDHPSKPHPSMILTAMAETGATPENTVMIGDTTFDMEMGTAAGVKTLGVTWGYHAEAALRAKAEHIVHAVEDIPAALDELWSN